jgi:hypothetical protein
MLLGATWLNFSLVNESRSRVAQGRVELSELSRDNTVSEGDREAFESAITETSALHAERLAELRKVLSPEHYFKIVLSQLATLPGIALSVIFVAVWIGSEQRWGYPRTEFVHQPRRTAVTLSKFIALGVTIAAVLVVAVLVTFGAAIALSRIHELGAAWSSPSLAPLVLSLAKAWLVMMTMAAVCGALTLAFRNATFGIVGTCLLMIGDLLAVRVVPGLRTVSPVQTIARLADPTETFDVIGRIWVQPAAVQTAAGFVPRSGGAGPSEGGVIVLIVTLALATSLAIAAVKSKEY